MAKPDVFADVTFEGGVVRSRTYGSVMIVDAMATWCGPCKQMDQITWVDEAVVARLTGASRAFAIQVDVDAEPAVAERLEVRSMPTLIAFVNGVEHDRVVGGRSPADFLAWLDMVERGERFEDVQRALRVELQDRRLRAAEALATERYADATVEYVWLWERVRTAELVDEMMRLATAHPAARDAFRPLRDAEAPRPDEPVPAMESLFTWVILNRIIGDSAATLAWYDANAASLPSGRQITQLLEREVVPLLIDAGRWNELGVLLGDPVAMFQRHVSAKLEPVELRRHAANLARALYATARDERANDLEYEATDVDPSPEMRAALATAKSLGRDDRVDVLIGKERWEDAGTLVLDPVARLRRARPEMAATVAANLIRALEAAHRDGDARAVRDASTEN